MNFSFRICLKRFRIAHSCLVNWNLLEADSFIKKNAGNVLGTNSVKLVVQNEQFYRGELVGAILGKKQNH
jgi:hypothetical protein